MKNNKLDKIILEEISNAIILREMSKIEKEKHIGSIMSRVYMMIMRGQIEDAKRKLASDPELQKLTDNLNNSVDRLVSKLREDPEAFYTALSKLADQVPPKED